MNLEQLELPYTASAMKIDTFTVKVFNIIYYS